MAANSVYQDIPGIVILKAAGRNSVGRDDGWRDHRTDRRRRIIKKPQSIYPLKINDWGFSMLFLSMAEIRGIAACCDLRCRGIGAKLVHPGPIDQPSAALFFGKPVNPPFF